MHRQAQLKVRQRDRKLPVGSARVWRVLPEQLELCDVPGGEVPRAGVKLEDLEPIRRGRVDPVEPTRHERLLAGGGVDVPEPRGDEREGARD